HHHAPGGLACPTGPTKDMFQRLIEMSLDILPRRPRSLPRQFAMSETIDHTCESVAVPVLDYEGIAILHFPAARPGGHAKNNLSGRQSRWFRTQPSATDDAQSHDSAG